MQLLLGAASAVFAVGPILFFLWLVWWLDRYDREPIWLLLLVFAWGAVGGTGLAVFAATALLDPLATTLDPTAYKTLATVVIAPLVEEPAKALVLIPLALSRHFDNTTDGFVYGTAAGLGFAMTENFLYFLTVGQTGDIEAYIGTVVVRTLYSAIMHASATSIVGAAVGFVKLRGWPTRLLGVSLALGLAMTIHAVWNGVLMADENLGAGGDIAIYDFVLFPIGFLVLFAMFQVCLLDERATIRRELREESERGLIPTAHLSILASYVQRTRSGWLPAHVDQHRYVAATTTLAFRKHEERLTGRPSEEIEALRREVDGLLRPPQGPA